MRGPALDLKHLQMIRMLAETSRLTDAADRLGVTPSALSHRIREAERRLDVALYTRTHKRLQMTPSATYLAQVADRILLELERAEEDVRRMNRGVRHVVRIAVEAYSSYHWLPGFLRFLRARTDGIDLQVTAAAGRDPAQSLTNRSVDLAIVSGEAARFGAALTHLFDDELLFIMPPGHRLAGRPAVEGPDIVGEDFITYTKVPEPDREYARLFRPSGSYPNWTETVELPEAIVELVAAGLGISVLAGWAVRGAIADGRVITARVGGDGLSVAWFAAIRPADAEAGGAIAQVAQLLSEWCSSPEGGFGTMGDGSCEALRSSASA